MRWTYGRIQEYVRRVRWTVLGKGCRKCKRLAPSLELAGTPSLTRLARDGYGIERIKEAGKKRGWFCRSCAKSINKKEIDSLVEEWKKKKKQCPEPVNKWDWSDDAKWEYCLDGIQEGVDRLEVKMRAHEVWEGNDLKESLDVIQGLDFQE